MKCVLKIFLFALVFAGVTFAEAQGSDEPSVSKFRERFSLRFLCDYNFGLHRGTIAFGEHLEQKYVSAFEILVVRRF